jgi:hypothetical protein
VFPKEWWREAERLRRAAFLARAPMAQCAQYGGERDQSHVRSSLPKHRETKRVFAHERRLSGVSRAHDAVTDLRHESHDPQAWQPMNHHRRAVKRG